MFPESLAPPNKPAGYQDICQLVTSGELSDPERIVEAANTFWDGVEEWSKSEGIQIIEELDDLIEKNEDCGRV
jgi:kanamycin nucleotidyltransferase